MGVATSTWWVEAKDSAKSPTLDRTAPMAKNDLASKVKSAETEEPSHRSSTQGRSLIHYLLSKSQK